MCSEKYNPETERSKKMINQSSSFKKSVPLKKCFREETRVEATQFCLPYSMVIYQNHRMEWNVNGEEKREAREEEQSIETCHSSAKTPRTLPSEMSTSHTLSALSIHKGSEIIPRAMSAPAISTESTRKQCSQSERWKERKQNLAYSRTAKKKSNIIAHRQDNGYYIAGSKMPLIDRYDIDEEELIKLRMLAHSRAERSTRASSVNSSVRREHAVSPGISPSGQNSSPVPPTLVVEEEKRKKILERRSQMKDEREIRKEMRREQQREKAKRFEEKQQFEKQMEEKYKPKIPEKKSLIFLTEQSDDEKKQNHGIFLTESDFMIDEGGDQASTYTFINEKQRLAFSSIFNEMDKNQDGRIDINELKQNLFPLASKSNLRHLLQVFDLNQDHMVEMREFITICALNDQLCGVRTDSGTTSLALDLERLAQHITIYKEIFDVIDEDRDGHIQTDEILLMITTAVAGDEIVDENEATRVLENIEKDEKGNIDFTSFMSYIPFFAKLLQVIMDSPLSIKNLEEARDRVIRKYSRNPEETT